MSDRSDWYVWILGFELMEVGFPFVHVTDNRLCARQSVNHYDAGRIFRDVFRSSREITLRTSAKGNLTGVVEFCAIHA